MMTARRLRNAWWLTVALSGVAIAAGCQVVAGLEDRTVASGVADASTSPDGGPADPCAVVGIPPIPAPETSSPQDALSLRFALHSVGLGVGKTEGTFGFNLDKQCTCPAADTCVRPAASTGGTDAAACDDPQGVDRSMKAIFNLLPLLSADESAANGWLNYGRSGVLIRVDGYNGKADDQSVRVSVYASLGTGKQLPKWDGNDVWTVDRSTVSGSVDSPNFVDPSAYVSGGSLVTNLRFPIVIGSESLGGSFRIDLSGGVFVAKIVDEGGPKKLDGNLGGRVPVTGFLKALSSFKDPSNQSLCKGNFFYDQVKDIACKSRDIMQFPEQDKSGASCNSMSLGLTFIAEEAKLGDLGDPPDAGEPCGPNYAPDCN